MIAKLFFSISLSNSRTASHQLYEDFSLRHFQIPLNICVCCFTNKCTMVLLRCCSKFWRGSVISFVSIATCYKPIQPSKSGIVLEHLIEVVLSCFYFFCGSIPNCSSNFYHLKMMFHIHLYIFEFSFYFEHCSWRDTDSAQLSSLQALPLSSFLLFVTVGESFLKIMPS